MLKMILIGIGMIAAILLAGMLYCCCAVAGWADDAAERQLKEKPPHLPR